MTKQSPQLPSPRRRTQRPAQFGTAKRTRARSFEQDHRMLVIHMQREYFSPYATRQ